MKCKVLGFSGQSRRLDRITESIRGAEDWPVWDYTGSCRSIYRPLMVDTTGCEYRIQLAVVCVGGPLVSGAHTKYT